MPSACPDCRPAPWRSRPAGPDRCASPLPSPTCGGSSSSGSTTSRRATPANACSSWGSRRRGRSRSPRWTSPMRNWTASKLDGLEAADMALRLGDADLASATLDQATAPSLRRGRYGRALEIEGRRLELVPRLRDQVEIGDVFAMMAWCSGEAGRWSDVVRYASEGERTVEVAINSRRHMSWHGSPKARYRTGDWDGGGRHVRHGPRHAGRSARRSAGLRLQRLRIDGPDPHVPRRTRRSRPADRPAPCAPRLPPATPSRRIWPYVNRLLVARGAVDEAWERFQTRPPAGGSRAPATSRRCVSGCRSPTAGIGRTTSWREVVSAADDGDLVGVRLFADRLAGLARAATTATSTQGSRSWRGLATGSSNTARRGRRREPTSPSPRRSATRASTTASGTGWRTPWTCSSAWGRSPSSAGRER